MFHIDPVIVLDAPPLEWHIRLAAHGIINQDRADAAANNQPTIFDPVYPD